MNGRQSLALLISSCFAKKTLEMSRVMYLTSAGARALKGGNVKEIVKDKLQTSQRR